jgi:hypothetical protein
MSWRLHANKLLVFVFTVSLLHPVLPDTLQDSNSVKYGKLTGISSGKVEFNLGCEANNRISVPLGDFRSLQRNSECKPPKYNATSSPIMLPCHQAKVILFDILFQGKQEMYATSLSVEDETATTKLFQTQQSFSGPLQEITAIFYGETCPGQMTPSTWPDSYHEIKASPENNPKKHKRAAGTEK